jgi:HAD superfamily hydrolase (TIGR01509 family)
MIDYHGLDDRPEQLLAESDELYGAMLGDQLQPMRGLDAWIQQLQRLSLPFGLATSSRRKFVDRIFESIGWRDCLAFMLTGDDVSQGKPHPEMYLRAAERFGIAPASMLVLEDSGNGCAAAVAAGAQTVAVPSEHTRGQNFDGAILVADSLLDRRLWALLPS